MKLSKGKYAGLAALSNEKGVIAAAAMDQRGSLMKSIAQAKGIQKDEVTYEMMAEFKTAVTQELSPYASALLLDPTYGLPATKALHKNCGLLLAYEETGYDQNTPGRIPSLIHGWTVRAAQQAGAKAIKVLTYYTPFEDKKINERKHAWVERIGQECVARDIPFFLEFVGYDPKGGDEKGAEFAKQKPEIVRLSIEEFSKPQYAVDILKVEIPVNMKFVEGSKAFSGTKVYSKSQALDHYKRSAEAAGCPFIYLSAGVDDDVFRESLEYAIEADVNFAGVLCGRATWKEGIPVYGKEGLKAFTDWLRERGVKNINALNEVLNHGAHAWSDFYGGKVEVN